MDTLLQDVRFGLRMLVKTPGFTLVVMLTLALGIGANTAIFTLLDQVLLRSLPVRDPQQLVQFRFSGVDSGRINVYGGDAGDFFSYPMYKDLRDRNGAFSGVVSSDITQVGVQWHNQPDQVTTELVSGNYFDVLGVRPALGRFFAQSDDVVQSANPVIVLSFAYWQRRFGSDANILNQTVLVNGNPFTVIGVTPPSFHSIVVGLTPGVFAPMMMKPQITPGWNDLDNRRSRWLNIFGRLKPGVGRQQAEAEINTLWRSIRADEVKDIHTRSATFPERFVEKSHVTLVDAERGFSPLREQIRTPLLIVMGMVGLVLLIACSNVAGLLLVRSAGRVKEISIRYALGAKQGRMVQQLLVEGVLLGLGGGVLGLVLAQPVVTLLLRRVASDSGGNMAFTANPDFRILLFNFGLAVAVSLLFSLAPALHFWRPDLTPALKQQTTTVGASTLRFRRISAGVQIGLSLLLLVGAGLFVRTLYELRNLDPGLSTDHLVTFGIDPKLAGYEEKDIPALYQRLLATLGGLPGVRSVAATNDPVLAGDNENTTITIAGYEPKEEEDMNAEWSIVTPAYFTALQTPVVVGRSISEADGPDAGKVVVINESLAKHFFGDSQHALGQYLARNLPGAKPDMQIVGVTRDAKHESLRNDVPRTVFLPLLQASEAGHVPLQFYVRTWQAPESAEATIRSAMQNVDSRIVLDTMRTMDEQVDDNLSTERTVALLATSFGVLAVLLAAIGLYGVLAYSTVQRTREIGIRIALGAKPSAVAKLILSEVSVLAGVSIALALPLALMLSRLLKSQLFGVSSNDPLTLSAMTVLVALMALLAAWIPMHRAARVDPMVALRYE